MIDRLHPKLDIELFIQWLFILIILSSRINIFSLIILIISESLC